MLTVFSRFISVAVGLTIVFLLVQLFYYFKHKRENTSPEDKALWKLRLSTAFTGALFLIAMVYVPEGFYRDIDLSPAKQDTVLTDLVHNQQRIVEDLRGLKEVLFVLFVALAAYLWGASSFIGGILRDRRRIAIVNDPKLSKPLGLDTG